MNAYSRTTWREYAPDNTHVVLWIRWLHRVLAMERLLGFSVQAPTSRGDETCLNWSKIISRVWRLARKEIAPLFSLLLPRLSKERPSWCLFSSSVDGWLIAPGISTLYSRTVPPCTGTNEVSSPICHVPLSLRDFGKIDKQHRWGAHCLSRLTRLPGRKLQETIQTLGRKTTGQNCNSRRYLAL